MNYKGYWIQQAPEDASYEVYDNHALVQGGFETLEDAQDWLDETDA